MCLKPSPAGKANGKPALCFKPAAAAPAAEPAAEATGDEDVLIAAINGISAVLEKKPEGCAKLQLRTGTFNAVKAAVSEDMASAVIDTFFGSDKDLNMLLGQVGFVVAGPQVKPIA